MVLSGLPTSYSFAACDMDGQLKKMVPEAGAQAGTDGEASTVGLQYVKAKVDDQYIHVIPMNGKALESPVVSADGKKIIVIGNKLAEKFPPTEMFVKDLTSTDLGASVKKPLLNIFIKGSFTPTGEIVACELEHRPFAVLKSAWDFFKTHEWEPKGYHSVISFYKNGIKTRALDAAEFGLPKTTFLEHPRVAEDGKWLSFYTQSDKNTQGIYIYNQETRKTFYMGNFPDKHPTWSPDGKRIFFHEQGKLNGSKEEIARVGYYDINFDQDQASLGKRVILGDASKQLGTDYVYQKHPAYHQGLNMVFFHARDGLNGKKSIAAMSLDYPDHAPIFMKLKQDGEKISHAQHADVSNQADSPLYFVGRTDKEKKSKLIQVDFEALKQLQKQFQSNAGVSP
jgi:hypothetical protein